jgi:hypothetical protein
MAGTWLYRVEWHSIRQLTPEEATFIDTNFSQSDLDKSYFVDHTALVQATKTVSKRDREDLEDLFELLEHMVQKHGSIDLAIGRD